MNCLTQKIYDQKVIEWEGIPLPYIDPKINVLCVQGRSSYTC